MRHHLICCKMSPKRCFQYWHFSWSIVLTTCRKHGSPSKFLQSLKPFGDEFFHKSQLGRGGIIQSDVSNVEGVSLSCHSKQFVHWLFQNSFSPFNQIGALNTATKLLLQQFKRLLPVIMGRSKQFGRFTFLLVLNTRETLHPIRRNDGAFILPMQINSQPHGHLYISINKHC